MNYTACASTRVSCLPASLAPRGHSPPVLLPPPFTHHLDVRDGNVKVLREVGVPNKANVGQEHASQVALVRREVPHALDLFNRFKETGQRRKSPRSAYAQRLGMDTAKLWCHIEHQLELY